MVTLRVLSNEHQEVCAKLEALKGEAGDLFVGQLLESCPLLLNFPDFIEKAILPHFKAEEKAVFPLLGNFHWGEKLREELLVEHTFLRDRFVNYFSEVRKGIVTGDLLNIAQEICNRLVAHARKEDDILIPVLRKWLGLSADDPLPSHAPPVAFPEEGAA